MYRRQRHRAIVQHHFHFQLKMLTLFAQKPTGLGGTIGGEGLGPFAVGLTEGNIGQKLTTGISSIIGFLTIVAGLWFLFQFIIGGLQWLGSSGDKTALEGAQKKLTNAFIGLVIVVVAIAIINILGTFLGFDILNPASFLKSIQLLPGAGQ